MDNIKEADKKYVICSWSVSHNINPLVVEKVRVFINGEPLLAGLNIIESVIADLA